MRPPIISHSFREMASPRPVPPNRREWEPSTCSNSRKIFPTCSAGMPIPVSLTSKANLYLTEAAIKINDVKAEVERRFGKEAKDVYVRADRNVTWDVLAQVVSAIKEAELRAQLVTKAEDIPDRRR